ncbi:MAG TPA: CRISPR-associated helicase Cas3' [archaeon]|nr:CRISPR-associated helicase Cas3' [archaeon]
MSINLTGIYVHTPGPSGQWDTLDYHAKAVSDKARFFAKTFCAGDIAYLLGLWHDLGKINPNFQDYLKATAKELKHEKIPHAIWGAALAYFLLCKKKKLREEWKEIALPIAGHHVGLNSGGRIAQNLEDFINNNSKALNLLIEACKELPSPKFIFPNRQNPFRRELLIRMLFSTLVDADYIITEQHFNPDLARFRGQWPTLETLCKLFMKRQREFLDEADNNPTLVNLLRREVYENCLEAAENVPGLYRLTVPTGGGKTRSSLAFALRHGIKHGLRKVIVALPYTSIIDQTANVYRDILGKNSVLEHHSQVEIKDDEEQDPTHIITRLASENWDAPIIVTTTVQLFESLFANRTSRVRKLHNLAKSVIILDEVQTIPPELLKPTLDVLQSLVEDYGISLVLSTATQPALYDTPYLAEFRNLEIHEIVPNYKEHFNQLKRVNYDLRKGHFSWEDIAKEVRNHEQVMVILNTRKDALALLDALEDISDVFHLSALLCGANRRKILNIVKDKLLRGLPVRLISTQVVEAGVDIDFPVVYRAVGPLDRIVQAAGRCNREGTGKNLGQVVIFEPIKGGTPGGPYKKGIEQARLILQRHTPDDLHNPELYKEYFQRLFSDINLDIKNIQEQRESLDYPEVAKRYRLIEQDTVAVVVKYGKSEIILKEWIKKPCRKNWRKLQPYLVNLFIHEAQKFIAEGWLQKISEGLFHWKGKYDKQRGIAEAVYDPSDLVI